MSPGRSKTVLEIATAKPRTPAQVRDLMAPAEKHEQRALIAWADVHNNPKIRKLYAVPNSGGYTGGFKKNKARVVSAAREGVRKGFPDLCLPVARGGHHSLYIELKKVNATPSDTTRAQLAWHIALREEGHFVMICNGADAAMTVIESYLMMPEVRWGEAIR